tara:strand:+ start:2933 stop:3649 length:717 start_codon:yes stop_codon:yes gene_type:complete
MKEVIAMHGWGGDAQIWIAWRKYFTRHGWLWQTADRGYGKAKPRYPNWSKTTFKNSEHQRVVICHSLGTHLLDEQILKEATHIVLISSFSRFVPNNKESRAIKTALKGMQQAFGTLLEKDMLKTFFKKACSPHPTSALPIASINHNLTSSGRKKLQSDLELLINTSGLPCGFPLEARVLTIYGESDAILLPAANILLEKDLKKHLQISPTSWIINGEGHFVFMPEIMARVENWLEVSK